MDIIKALDQSWSGGSDDYRSSQERGNSGLDCMGQLIAKAKRNSSLAPDISSVEPVRPTRLSKRASGQAYTEIQFPGGRNYDLLTKISPETEPAVLLMLKRSLGKTLRVDQKQSVLLGQGAFGTIRIAKCGQTLFAAKKMQATHGALEAAAIKLLNRLPANQSDMFVKTFDIATLRGKSGKKTYFFQELMTQGSLESSVKPNGLASRFLVSKTGSRHDSILRLRLGLALVEPVAALHRVGLYHCDLKPANYMMHDGVIKLGDFGFLTDQVSPKDPSGTPAFVPPELFYEGLEMPKSDAFALGVMLYNLETGANPLDHYGTQGKSGKSAGNMRFPNQELRTVEFAKVAEDARKLNQQQPSMLSIALQLLHPAPSYRLGVEDAELLLKSLVESHSL